MANFLGGGGGQKTPRYTDINLQTSAQGLVIPILYGMNRLGDNLLWYGDFTSRTNKQSGKGGSLGKGGSSYYYSCAVVLGICEGPIYGINQVWAGTDITNLALLDLTLFYGTASQAPWSYLTSRHPTQALAYARTAYVASGAYQLGSSPDLPSHNLEVMGVLYNSTGTGLPDANPADIIKDYLTNPQYSIGLTTAKLAGNLANYKTYCQAQGIFMSPPCDQPEQVTQTIQRWAQLTNSWIFWSGDQLQFVPLGDSAITANGATYTPELTPIYNLGYDDFIVTQGENPVEVDIIDPADGFNQVEIDINDRLNAYNNTPIHWYDQTSIDQYGPLQSNVISAREICLQSIGQTCAVLIGQRAAYITKSYTFKLPRRFIFMEPGDIYSITEPNIGLVNFPVRITAVKSGTDRILTVTAEEFPYGVGTASVYTTQASSAGPTFNGLVPPGDVNPPAIFEPSAAQTGGVAQVWVGASGGANWGGANVYISFDGTTYSDIGTVLGGLLQGTLITSLPSSADPDTTDTLYVDLTESVGILPATASHADADALRTLVLVDSEVMAYGAVAQGALNSYSFDLTYLRRGQYGTAVAAHAAGAMFTRLDPNFIFKYDLPEAYVGQTLYFKFVSFNNFGNAGQDIADVAVYTYTSVGTAFTIGAPGTPTITPSAVTQSDGTTILSLTAAWTASAGPNLGSYDYQWSTDGGTTWTHGGSVGAATLQTVLAPALAATSYKVQVRAVSQNGQAVGAWVTSAATGSGSLVNSVPAAPSGIAANGVAGGAMVDWSPSSSLTTQGYQVSYGTSSSFGAATVYPVTTSGTGQLVTGLTAGTLYYFWVQAFNEAGASSPDGPVTATPTGLSGGTALVQGTVTGGSTVTIGPHLSLSGPALDWPGLRAQFGTVDLGMIVDIGIGRGLNASTIASTLGNTLSLSGTTLEFINGATTFSNMLGLVAGANVSITGSSGGFGTISASGSGGGSGLQNYSASTITPQTFSSGSNITVANCKITLPASANARTFLLISNMLLSGTQGCNNQFLIDGTTLAGVAYGSNAGSYTAAPNNTIVVIPGDNATHTIQMTCFVSSGSMNSVPAGSAYPTTLAAIQIA